MTNSTYHYTECGLNNIYLVNGFQLMETQRGQAISIKNIEGLHKAIGLFLITTKKDLTGNEIRFLRHEMLMSQNTLARLLGVNEQAIRRWENGKINIPNPSASLLRLLYREHAKDHDGEISSLLKKIANLEDNIDKQEFFFRTTADGWHATA